MLKAERVRGGFPPWMWREHEARYRFAAGLVRGKVVVDCACGMGFGTVRFVDAGAERVHAFDASKEAVAAAQEILGGRGSVSVASATALPLPDASAEVFVSLETIEHIEDDEAYLDEVVRVLAPGGVFVCSTPNRTVTNPGLPREGRPQNPFHVREYAPSELAPLLAKRFAAVEWWGQNPVRPVIPTVLGSCARVLPFRIPTRLWQLSKFRYLLPSLRREHEVQRALPGLDYETMVVVCSKPVLNDIRS